MGEPLQTTIDSAGRLVLPKEVREEAGILPGMTLRITVQEGKVEIEPLPLEVRIVQQGPLWIAVPAEAGPALSGATVDQVLRKVREARGVACRGPARKERAGDRKDGGIGVT